MYNLAIDIGNSSVKAAIFEQERMVHQFSFVEFDKNQFVTSLLPYPIDKAIIASSGAIPTGLHDALKEVNSLIVELRDVKTFSFENRYGSQETLGQDRVALIEGALKDYAPPLLVISCGTCITYNYIDERGAFIGGAISPGLLMRAKAMSSFTAHLPQINIPKEFPPFIGNDTVSCLKAGVLVGFKHEINGFIDQYQQYNPGLTIIITGGDAVYLESQPKNKIFVDLFLTLKGLNQILQKHEI